MRQGIERHDDGMPAPLSSSQERVWLFDQLGVGRFAYNESRAFLIEGALDRNALRSALDAVVARHAALRATFHSADGGPFQTAQPARPIDWHEIDLQLVPPEERREALQRALADEALRPFDLSRDVLVRPTLAVIGPSQYVFLVTLHHIAADEWSFGILNRELSVFYAAEVGHRPAELGELPFQYPDYARWQRQTLDDERLAKQLAYWQRQLHDLPLAVDLPVDYARPPIPSHRGARQAIVLPARLLEVLRQISPGVTSSLFTTLLASFQVLLHRLSGQTDIVVGTSMMNRAPPETESLIGFFLQLLVLRGDLSGDPTFRQFLLQFRRVAWSAYTNNDVPFQRLVEVLRPKRDPSRNPLFQIGFVNLGATRHALRLGDLTVRPFSFDPGLTKFDLTLYLEDVVEPHDDAHVGDMRVSAEYSLDLFAAESVRSILEAYRALLEAIAADPDAVVSRLPLESCQPSPRAEPALDAVAAPVYQRRVHELVEEQAKRSPAAVAVKFRGKRISYGQLSQRANRLAQHLRTMGVGPGTAVGLCLDRSPDLLVGVLAIFKAGGMCLPLDPNDSPDRLAAIVAEAAPLLIITHEKYQSQQFDAGPPCFCLDRDQDVLARYRSSNAPDDASDGDDATLIFTGRAPGDLIGVIGRHRGILHGIAALEQVQSFDATDVCGVVGELRDEHVLPALFAPLLRGGTLAIVESETAGDPRRLIASLRASGVTRVVLSQHRLGDLLDTSPNLGDKLPRLRYWSCGEGPLSREVIAKFRASLPGRTLLCSYGGPEVAGAATCFTPLQWDSARAAVPIGWAVGNGRVYLLAADGTPVPPGVRGTMCLGGDAVAAGYLNQPTLTAERFIENPFADQPGARLFRTSDVGRALPDGSIELLPRSTAPLVADAQTARPAVETVPDQPARGPLDRQNLRRTFLRDWIELQLVNIWKSVLGVDQVGPEDNFFDLGGYSLLAVRLFEQVENVFGKRLPLEVLFKAPTIRGLARVLRQSGPISASCVVPIQPTGSRPPFFFVHGLGGATIAYRLLAMHLGTEQPFYGIQAPEPKGHGGRPDSIQERAALYVAGIRQIQPEGPYYLGGYSGGGVWAYEMAQQLVASGESIAIVLFLDVAFPGSGSPRRIALERIRRDLDALEGLTADERQKYEQWALRRAMDVARGINGIENELGTRDGSIIATYRRIQREHVRAIREYRPRPYTGRVVHLRAGDPSRFDQPGDPYAGWRRVVGANLEVIGVPGEHLTLLREPNVRHVAKLMREYLEAAQPSDRAEALALAAP
jgi:non-ribosomal peptide synthetase component F/thioesterase domain-containing protein/acyl carrier protein